MQTCKVTNCNNTNIVHSEISALMYGGIPVATYCHSCANAYNQISILANN